MSQIKQLLLLKKEGVSNRKAAGIIGINKETVNNYVRKARTPNFQPRIPVLPRILSPKPRRFPKAERGWAAPEWQTAS